MPKPSWEKELEDNGRVWFCHDTCLSPKHECYLADIKSFIRTLLREEVEKVLKRAILGTGICTDCKIWYAKNNVSPKCQGSECEHTRNRVIDEILKDYK